MSLADAVLDVLSRELQLDRKVAGALAESLGPGTDTPESIRRWAHAQAWTYNEARGYIERTRRVLAQLGQPADPVRDPEILLGPPESFLQAIGPVTDVTVLGSGEAHERLGVRLAVAPFTFTYETAAPHAGEARGVLRLGVSVRIWASSSEVTGWGGELRIWQLRSMISRSHAEVDGPLVIPYAAAAAYYGEQHPPIDRGDSDQP